MSLLDVTELSHSFGDKRIFIDAALRLNKGDKMGLTGLNGAGKSTLMRMLIGEVIPDAGQIRWAALARVGYLDQEATVPGELTIEQYLQTAFAEGFADEARAEQLNAQLAQTEDVGAMERLLGKSQRIYERLERTGFYEMPVRIARTAEGLGLTAMGMDRRLDTLSGGQRAKVLLAKLLLQQPDVLLLDVIYSQNVDVHSVHRVSLEGLKKTAYTHIEKACA